MILQTLRTAMQAELDMSDWPRNWQAAVQRVLENVLKLSEALPFAEPVPVEEVPGYQELVPNPMDLGTVLWRSKASSYDTPLEALADVRQVSNCHTTGTCLVTALNDVRSICWCQRHWLA